jgi:hypothetical protein
MVLERQTVQAPMRFGLDEGTDPHQVPFGTLLTAENCRWARTGTIGKRFGTTALGMGIVGGGSIAAAARLVVRDTELALTDGTSLYSSTSGGWILRGRHPEVGLTWGPPDIPSLGVKAADTAYLSNGQLVTAWVTGDPEDPNNAGNVWYRIADVATGAIVQPPTEIDSNGRTFSVRIVATGSTFAILWCGGGSTANILCFCAGTTTTLVSSTAKQCPLDACVVGANFDVAYLLAAGGIALKRYSFAATPVLQASGAVTGETSTSIAAISIAGASGESLYVAYADLSLNRTRFAIHDALSLAQTTGPTLLDSATGFMHMPTVGICRLSSTEAVVLTSYCDGTAGSGTALEGALFSRHLTSAGSIGPAASVACLKVQSKPFVLGSGVYAAASNFVNAINFETVGTIIPLAGSDSFLVDVTAVAGVSTPIRLVAHLDVLTSGEWTSGHASSASFISANEAIVATATATSAAQSGEPLGQGFRTVHATVGPALPPDMWRTVQFGSEAYLCAGVLTAYDGVEAIGYGFPHAAFIDATGAIVSASGGGMGPGTYQYNIVPERKSWAGILHRGPTTIGQSFTAPGGGLAKISVAFIPIELAAGKRDQLLTVFRTVANGSIPQRLTIEPSIVTVPNAIIASPVFAVDGNSDSSVAGIPLSKRPAIYTASGELDDYQPPACLTSTIHQSRLWIVAADGRTVWISKDRSANPGVAPGFHPTQILQFDQTVTALASMDDKLVAFAADRLWFVIGDGAAPNGLGATYQINKIQADVGCINPRSVVSTPDGIMFQSTRGLHLLTRDLGVAWIGRQVKDILAAFPNVTSAVLVPSANEIRFTCNDAGSASSTVLVYNYVERQWTTSRYTVGGVYGAPIADAILFGGVWTFVTPSGQVVQESTATYLDGAAWVPLTIETSWYNAAGPLAFQSADRFGLEGIANSNHDLTVSVGFNTEASYSQTATFLAGSTVTSIGPFESCGITVGTRRKCQAIRFKIQDATPTNSGSFPVGTGQGPSFDMLGFTVGIKKGLGDRDVRRSG